MLLLNVLYLTTPGLTFTKPFNTLIEAVNEVESGGIIFIKSSSSNETIDINVNKNFTIRAWNGSSLIGQ